jgi:uncharacterized LabA/DUF88 family protein
MEDELRAAVIMDYQNVHLTGAGLFEPNTPKHECLIHPLHYANHLIQARNKNQRQGLPTARLERVLVHRGLPSAEHDPKPYARNLAQKTEWERDPRVKVTLRPLKYRYERTEDGRKATDATGRPIIVERLEKGVDVLCALALIREARDPNIDLVILASQDTDLEPALDEALALGTAKVETASWYDNVDWRASKEIRPRRPARIWNTRLNAQAFMSAQDRKDYR